MIEHPFVEMLARRVGPYHHIPTLHIPINALGHLTAYSSCRLSNDSHCRLVAFACTPAPVVD